MIVLPARVMIAMKPVDFRRGMMGLGAIVEAEPIRFRSARSEQINRGCYPATSANNQ